jgi:allantoicase
MDGWETRRRREPGHDWVVVKLGLPGVIRGVNVDTSHFTGNFPEYCSLEATAEYSNSGETRWTELIPKSRLQGGSHNLISVSNPGRWTHVRLNIFPDGGVARLRLHGEVRRDLVELAGKGPIDLAALENGATVVAANDMYFGPKDNLIMPGRAANMGEGWETKRKRVPGYDWCVVKLAAAGRVSKIEVDTNHFKGNYPDSCSIEGNVNEQWEEILPKTKLGPHARHFFEKELRKTSGPVTHVRLNIYPDGGVSRLRVYGELAQDA